MGDLNFLCGKSFKSECQAKAPGWKHNKSLAHTSLESLYCATEISAAQF